MSIKKQLPKNPCIQGIPAAGSNPSGELQALIDKEIAGRCKIKNLTTHLARHTFATTVSLTNGILVASRDIAYDVLISAKEGQTIQEITKKGGYFYYGPCQISIFNLYFGGSKFLSNTQNETGLLMGGQTIKGITKKKVFYYGPS
ncbi:MAG: hypothetical protein R2814_04270 [Flavobacteriaceae bacterium]